MGPPRVESVLAYLQDMHCCACVNIQESKLCTFLFDGQFLLHNNTHMPKSYSYRERQRENKH